jgi:FKBP-type peptidyl-prolyl cis-trans isomerase
MKKSLLFAGAGLMLLTACGGNTGKSMEDAKPSTPSDSLSYVLGEFTGHRFSSQAEMDTANYGTEQQRKDYMDGMMKGFELLDGNSDAYNAGLMEGLNMAQSVKQFKEQCTSFEFNKGMYESGLRYAGANEKADKDAAEKAQQALNTLTQEFVAAQEKVDNEVLAKYAKEKGYTQVTDNSFIKHVKPGNGNLLADGDSISFSVVLKSTSGKNLDQYSQHNNTAVIGKQLPTTYPYYDAIKTMKPGETADILMNPKTLFGNYASQLGLDADEYIILTIDTQLLSAPKVAPTATNL